MASQRGFLNRNRVVGDTSPYSPTYYIISFIKEVFFNETAMKPQVDTNGKTMLDLKQVFRLDYINRKKFFALITFIFCFTDPVPVTLTLNKEVPR
jgi:hypothetical protein